MLLLKCLTDFVAMSTTWVTEPDESKHLIMKLKSFVFRYAEAIPSLRIGLKSTPLNILMMYLTNKTKWRILLRKCSRVNNSHSFEGSELVKLVNSIIAWNSINWQPTALISIDNTLSSPHIMILIAERLSINSNQQ